MTYIMIGISALALILSIAYSVYSVKRGRKPARAFAYQLLSFVAICVVCFSVPAVTQAATNDDAAPTATAAETTQTEAAGASSQNWLGLIAAALAVGIAGIGGGIAVAAAAPAAIGATSEDPKAFGKAMIFVALGEGIALYGLLIAILIWMKC